MSTVSTDKLSLSTDGFWLRYLRKCCKIHELYILSTVSTLKVYIIRIVMCIPLPSRVCVRTRILPLSVLTVLTRLSPCSARTCSLRPSVLTRYSLRYLNRNRLCQQDFLQSEE